ncbi:MAG: RluA family pseudouridine synthase [Prevotellaceae bacterium]|jgi:23S rRNA pseudouridine1911/1915/1917 synthase|nr:RluA family pseudouridine synthase [Prevotellaceae bacterium]
MRKKTLPQRKFYTKDFFVKEKKILLDFLLEVYKEKSRSEVKSYLAHRQISVNGKCVNAFDFHLQKGDNVRFSSTGEEKPNPNHKCRIVFEDDDIIVIEKKNGVLSMSNGTDGITTAYSLMMEHVRRRNRDNRVFIVHRLDRDTSGLMLLAKNQQSQEILQSNWNENIISRKYIAVVEGGFTEKGGQIVSWLTESPKTLKMHSSPVDNGGKKAITNYMVLKSGEKYSLLELELETGRKNQIRVQLASVNHAVAGDKKYGATANPLKRICLHAKTLEFFHPRNKKKMSFDSGIPREFL